MGTKAKSFPGGMRVKGFKEATGESSIVNASTPKEAIIPLLQHAGFPGIPLVKKGDRVRKGQKIGDGEGPSVVPVHASVSGVVSAVEPRLTPRGRKDLCILIQVDKRVGFSRPPLKQYCNPPDTDTLINIIKEAGIVGLGGAAFPAHLKLASGKNRLVDTVILNGCECEPYLTGDHRLMIEAPDRIVAGLEVIMQIVGAYRGCVALEDNQPLALASLKKACAGKKYLGVIPLKARYPQGAEKLVVKAVLGRDVPTGGLPLDAGVVVHNVETALAIYQAVYQGRSLVERVITVSGDNIRRPANLMTRIGTPLGSLIKDCGGLIKEQGKIIAGGPMMGKTQFSLQVPVTREITALVALSEKKVVKKTFFALPRSGKTPGRKPFPGNWFWSRPGAGAKAGTKTGRVSGTGRLAASPGNHSYRDTGTVQEILPGPCIRCGRCVEVCPMGLLPSVLAELSEHGKDRELVRINLFNCMECGACTFICPAWRPLLHRIKLAKARCSKE